MRVLVKIIRLVFAAVLLICLFSGCAANDNSEVSTDKEASTGGASEIAENINLKDIDITADGDQTIVTLSLLSGSREAGYSESKLTQLPEYEITQLNEPQRIMITINNISFWDYEEDDETWALSDFVLGLFREVPADDESLIIYIQLSQSSEIVTEESEGDLIISLTPAEQNEGSKYFCASNSFLAHQDGTWPDSIDMMPVLCSDSENKLLISAPFDTEDEATALMETANETLAGVLPDNTVYVIELAAGALPDYSANIDYSISDDINVVMTDGVIVDTPLLLQNGRYLATASDGRIAFSRSYTPEEPALEQDSYLSSEKLWILETNGRIQNIEDGDFYAIEEVAFSSDGRYISILDVSIENSVLYIYDFETEELINLGEEGFGSQTSAFAWSDTDNTLYAMTGYTALQMLSCTFDSDGSFEIDAVEEEAGAVGHLGVSNGRLIFADNYAGEAGIIYEIGDERRTITEGIDFRIAPDNKTLLVEQILSAESSEDEQVLTSLKICDIETGVETEIPIEAGTVIVDYCFSCNGGKVFYSVDLSETEESEYQYGLYAYDLTSNTTKRIALCMTGEFATSGTAGELYLIDYIYNDENSFYATYIYDFS